MLLAPRLRRRFYPWAGGGSIPELPYTSAELPAPLATRHLAFRFFTQEGHFTCGYAVIRMILAGNGLLVSEEQLLNEARQLGTYSDRLHFTVPDLRDFLENRGYNCYYSYNWTEKHLASALANGYAVLLTVNARRLRQMYQERGIETKPPSGLSPASSGPAYDGHIVLLHTLITGRSGERTYQISDPAVDDMARFSLLSAELTAIAKDAHGVDWSIEALVTRAPNSYAALSAPSAEHEPTAMQ